MEDFESFYADYKYDLNEIVSLVKMLLNAAENEYNNLTHEDMKHNVEIVYDKLVNLYDKACVIAKEYQPKK